jgi:hypothetical protein
VLRIDKEMDTVRVSVMTGESRLLTEERKYGDFQIDKARGAFGIVAELCIFKPG